MERPREGGPEPQSCDELLEIKRVELRGQMIARRYAQLAIGREVISELGVRGAAEIVIRISDSAEEAGKNAADMMWVKTISEMIGRGKLTQELALEMWERKDELSSEAREVMQKLKEEGS
jgi:hypothetical protein